MCLIVHKPAGAQIPADLLLAAAKLNPDGWGMVGHRPDGSLILERHAELDYDAVVAAERSLRDAEYVLHLRRRTRGRIDQPNTHPFEVDHGVYLVHNGTLPLEGLAGQSDTRVFVDRVLRPLSRRHPGLLSDPQFLQLLELGLTPENKIVLYDHPQRRFHLVNRAHGVEFEGLWLSSIKWVDRSTLALTPGTQAQQRTYQLTELTFL